MKNRLNIVLTILLLGVAVQVLVAASRVQPVDVAGAPAAQLAVGDALPLLEGMGVDGNPLSVPLANGDGAVTLVFAYYSACAHSDTVAPDWASFLAEKGRSVGGARTLAVTRDVPGPAALYAERFGWDVEVLSMPDLTPSDIRHSLGVPNALGIRLRSARRAAVPGPRRRTGSRSAGRRIHHLGRAMKPVSEDSVMTYRIWSAALASAVLILPLATSSCGGDGPGDVPLMQIAEHAMTLVSPADDALWEVRDILEDRGTVWALTGSAPFVHGFAPSGGRVAAFGTAGEGPGEFRYPYGLWPGEPAGTLTVWDAGRSAALTVSGSGKLLSSRSLSEAACHSGRHSHGDHSATHSGSSRSVTPSCWVAMTRESRAVTIWWRGKLVRVLSKNDAWRRRGHCRFRA